MTRSPFQTGQPHQQLPAQRSLYLLQQSHFFPTEFRLYALLEAVAAGELDGLRAFVAAGDRAGFVAALGAIKGFGPSTAGAAWELWAADRG
jgi:hypothetical protein